MPENKKTTEKPQKKRSRENSNLTLPAGDEVPADREPFRSVRGRLPEMVSGCSAKEPARMPYLHEANLANLNSRLDILQNFAILIFRNPQNFAVTCKILRIWLRVSPADVALRDSPRSGRAGRAALGLRHGGRHLVLARRGLQPRLRRLQGPMDLALDAKFCQILAKYSQIFASNIAFFSIFQNLQVFVKFRRKICNVSFFLFEFVPVL